MLHTTVDVHAECHASRAHMRRTRGRDRLGSGNKEAWPAAQKHMDACYLHAVLPACHAMLFLMFMQYGMQHAWVAGAQDPEIGPTRPSDVGGPL